MRCARCHRLVVRGLRACAGCGAELPGAIGVEVSRLERPTERGPTGPLRDFSLHREPMNMRRAASPRTGGTPDANSEEGVPGTGSGRNGGVALAVGRDSAIDS